MSKLRNLLFLFPVALFSGKDLATFGNGLAISYKELAHLSHQQAVLARQYLQTKEALDEAEYICPGVDVSFLTSRLADLLKMVQGDRMVMEVIFQKLAEAENV